MSTDTIDTIDTADQTDSGATDHPLNPLSADEIRARSEERRVGKECQ